MKLLLAATTALVCVTSLASAVALPERQAGEGSGALDTNGEFLCNHGFKLTASGDDFFTSSWELAATPIIGTGNPVNEILVRDGPSSGFSNTGFRVGIYSSYGGKPKSELVGASASSHRCGRVKVPISPITLEKGKKYWLVQKALDNSGSGQNAIVWVYDKKRSHGALSQSGSWFCSSACSSHIGPWTPITTGVPYARVRFDSEAPKLAPTARSREPGGGFLDPAIRPARSGRYQGGNPRSPP